MRTPISSGFMGLIIALMLGASQAHAVSDGEWEQYGDPLATALPTEAELGPVLWSQIKGHAAGALLADWTSTLFDPGRRELCLKGGGHADYGGSEVYCWNVDTGTLARVQPILPLTNTTEPGYNASTSPWPSYGPPAQHTYDGFAFMSECLGLYAGTPGYSKSGLMSPGSTAHLFNRCTDPWTWTRRDDLRTYVRSMTGVYGDWLILHGSNGSIRLDRTTGAIVGSNATIKGVVMNGVTSPVAGYTSAFSAGGASTTGFFCAATGTLWLHCTNVNGGVRDIDGNGVSDNDTFGRFRRIPIGAGVGAHPIAALLAGYHSMATMPDGWFALWNGDKRLIFFRPSPTNNPAVDPDLWAVVEPETGPTDGTNRLTYDKIVWDAATCTLVGVSNRDEGLWRYNPDFIPDCPVEPPPPPQETAAPDEGDYGPSPQASLASLSLRAATVLTDPLDDTPISGAWAGACIENRTMTETIAGQYGDRRWVWPASGPVPAMMDNGALRFAMAPGGGSTAGRYHISPCDGVGPGETIRVRFKVKYSCDVLYTDCDPQSPSYKQERRKYQATAGAGGFKVFAVGEIYPDNGVLDGGAGLGVPIWSHYKQQGFPAGYIGVWQWEISTGGAIVNGVRQWDLQPGGPNTCMKGAVAAPGCYMFEADEWMTFQQDLTYGGCTTVSGKPYLSHVNLYIAREGQPFELVVSRDHNIKCSGTSVTGLIGRVGLDPFMTGKDPAEQHPVGYIWYDDVWVETL
jgi:hypothetical protein